MHPWHRIKACPNAPPELKTAVAGRTGPPDMTPHRLAAMGKKPSHFFAALRRQGISIPTHVPTGAHGQYNAPPRVGPNEPCPCGDAEQGPHKRKRCWGPVPAAPVEATPAATESPSGGAP